MWIETLKNLVIKIRKGGESDMNFHIRIFDKFMLRNYVKKDA